ncbi:RagB/SusD family nutrient uptake outer membrane protein [Flavobacterium ustbae]|uniref:RagB/SusD family nutrient uptake outer membrane protein n=1 Tax=Flavobacterium ustbae TaxID=2488790 RepID=UPI000F772D03|nr:RagB/SusD family nutrient uptake outer membrane protein [Flavobacterium ustbae]
MKIIYIKNSVLAFSMLLMLNSCSEDFLTIEPTTQLTADAIQTDSDFEALVNAAYDPLRWQVDGAATRHMYPVMFQDMRADNVVSQWATFWVAGQAFDKNPIQANNPSVEGMWKKWYTMISRANTAIGIISETEKIKDEAYKNQLIAQAKFLRGFAYFELVKHFGGVPLITEYIKDASYNFKKPKATAAEVYAQIEKDLLEAAQVLPTVAAKKGRTTKGAAYAVLAKANLYQKDYNETVKYCEQVISLGYSLEEKFEDNWDLNNEYGKESILEIGYISGSLYNNFEGNASYSNQGSSTHQMFGFLFNSSVGNSAFGNSVPRQELIDFYDNSDRRKEYTFITPQTIVRGGRGAISCNCSTNPDGSVNFATEGQWVFGTDTYNYFWPTGTAAFKSKASMYKYWIPPAVQDALQNYADSPLNEKIIRYADVLLMHAEARLMGGNGVLSGASSFQLVTERAYGAGNPKIPAYNLQGVKDERRRELATEGWDRYTDLVRWGDAKAALEAVGKVFMVGRDELLPIPASEIQQVGVTVLIQNPGY